MPRRRFRSVDSVGSKNTVLQRKWLPHPSTLERASDGANPSDDEEKPTHMRVIPRSGPLPGLNVWSHRASSRMPHDTSIREPWGTGPDEKRNLTANEMLELLRKKRGRPYLNENEMRIASSAGRVNTPVLGPSIYMKYPEVTPTPAARRLSPRVGPLEDQWDDLGYLKGTPAPVARQSRARVDVKQRERSPRAEASTPWSISLKSTISEDLSRHDKDQGAKLRYLQKRLDRETLKLFHGDGPHDHDTIINFTASRKGPYQQGNWDQLIGQ